MKKRLVIATILSIAILGISALLSAGSSAPPSSKSVQLHVVPSNELIRALRSQINVHTLSYIWMNHPHNNGIGNNAKESNAKESNAKESSVEDDNTKEVSLTSAPSSNPTTHVSPIQLMTGIPGLVWPTGGEAAVGAERLNFIDSNQLASPPVPIASLTKIMTAYVILNDHPLAPGEDGPTIRIDGADIETTYNDELNDETIVPIVHGEILTEKQALEGLMIHSACNLAYVLARWDSGSVSAFVAKMNNMAHLLGLSSTRYVGPAGFSPGSVSTATDLTKLTMAAMSIPAFAHIVDHPSINLPDAGTLYNYVSAIGQDGVIGVKSGFTYQSEGCVVLAAIRSIGGTEITLVATVTGQGGMDPLGSAQNIALALINSMASQLHMNTTDLTGDVIGNIRPSWLATHNNAHKAYYDIVMSGHIDLLEWPGAEPRVTIRFDRQSYACNTLHPNIQVGTMTVSLGTFTSSVPLIVPRVPRG